MYTGAATMKNNVESPQKIGVELPYDLTILLMGIYPKKTKNTNLKRYAHTHTHTHVPILILKAKIRKQPKGPSVNEWIKKIWRML